MSLNELSIYKNQLKAIFGTITEEHDGILYPKGKYNHEEIRGNIRKAFIPKRKIREKEEIIHQDASLLKIEKLISPIHVANTYDYFPSQEEVKKIIRADKGEIKLKAEIQKLVDKYERMPDKEDIIKTTS